MKKKIRRVRACVNKRKRGGTTTYCYLFIKKIIIKYNNEERITREKNDDDEMIINRQVKKSICGNILSKDDDGECDNIMSVTRKEQDHVEVVTDIIV